MAPPEPEAGAGQVIAGRYELVDVLARGGMGTVWVAQDSKLGRRVALKIMRPESLEAFPDARERFEREARASAALRSSHVVAVHDYGVDAGTPFIAMELLEGESLKERLERVGRMEVVAVAEILRQVAKGLKAAHKAGLVHRDLKPSNIFLTQRDDAEVVKLLDFGVVKTAMKRGSEDTASGVLLGTPQYMSPEQARGIRQVDHRADLWSVAVILYTALTGENPFDSEAEAVGDIVIRVCIDPILPPSVINEELPIRLDDFFDRALARDPDERFQSADELIASFMLNVDMSFAGLDERPGDMSGPGRIPSISGVAVAAPTSGDTTGPQRPTSGSHILDDPSSEHSSMSTSVDDPVAPPFRFRSAAIAVAVVGLGLGIYMMLPDSDASTPASVPSAVAPSATAPPSANPAPPPSVEVVEVVEAPTRPSASSSAKAPGKRPPVRVVPSSVTTAPKSSAGADEEKPPEWFND